MLQIKHISKKYVTGELTTMALDDVTLNFRDNEFVAVLGPSGSGKTTLLNVVGGLDRYDEGDLIINGISTKQYTDRDWDSYRNHTIGFVFQSYNLIPQQTVLSNVEIALTISGVSRTERRQRAIDALNQVGLGDQLHKKPNQMSGGQMQRVAIARALINNPDILLADEPTGALDTETSVQVMDLLKEVAKDRMVIMVTHNPDLAAQYATRIVRLQDGKIIGDSDPYEVDETEMAEPVHQNMGHSSMNMATSLGLSVNNLIAKRGRTLLTCFAGAIGIIAISLILAVSAGVNNYIDSLEEDTMAEYPVEVTSSGFDISSMMGTLMGTMEQVIGAEEMEDGFGVMTMISRMVNIITTNDLGPFKTYLESGETDIDKYAKAVEYKYDVEPQIYLEDGDNYHQVNPESTLTSGFGLGDALTSMMSSTLTMLNTFYQLPENEDLYIDSYDVMAGRWPEDYNECVLVISSTGTVADYLIYTLGLEDFNEYEDLIDEAMNGGEVPDVEYQSYYTYDSVIGTTYKLVNSADYYEYDSEYNVWTDKRDNESYMRQLVRNGEDITIVGVVKARSDATTAILNDGVNYPASLTEHVAAVASESEVVQDQLRNPEVNVLTGEEFGEDFSFDLEEMFNLDEDTLNELFDMDALIDAMDFSSLSLDLGSMDLSSMIDMDSFNMDLSGLSLDLGMDLADMDLTLDLDMSDLAVDISNLDLGELDLSGMINIDASAMTDVVLQLMEGYNSQDSTFAELQESFAEYMSSGGGMQALRDGIENSIRSATGKITRQEVVDLIGDLSDDNDIRTALTNLLINNMSWSDLTSSVSTALTEGYMNYGSDILNEVSVSLTEYLTSDAAVQTVTYAIMNMMDIDGIMEQIMGQYMQAILTSLSDTLTEQITAQMAGMMDGMSAQIEEQLGDVMSQAMSGMDMSSLMSGMDMDSLLAGMDFESVLADSMSGMSEDMLDAMDIDADTLMDAFDIDMDEDSLLEMMSSMSSAVGSSYEGVLADLGYIDYANPSEIDIYPKDFDSKDGITAIIDNYNTMVLDAGQEELEITYSDLMGTMMSTVSTIINIVTYVLIAFVSISLVVSAIMIGIITYISVLERTREIGILRALGASKRNVARIFNAETFIVGLIAGIMGVVIGLLLLIPINAVVARFVQDESIRAFLPALYGVLLVVLSVVLTLIGGIIPSRKASKMDPVAALRSE